VYLPRTEEAAAAPAAVVPHELHRGGETILVVEDDAMVRSFIQRALRGSGYQVLVAGDAQEALAVADRLHAPIQLLITDVVMPGRINGRELAGLLKRSRASMRVLYMSGYADDVIAKHGVLDPGVQFLQKPFPADALRSTVREVLTQAGPTADGRRHDSAL
jgi:DNA-binding response OmpR family regulator